jgi:hypothetical protein
MPKRSSAIANDGLGIEYVAEVPSNGGGRSWHGAVVVADRDSGDRKMMLVFTDQRPPYANVNGRALAEALERHDCVAVSTRLPRRQMATASRLDGLVEEDDFRVIFP